MTDQQELMLVIGIVAFIVNLWILSEIIKGATRSRQIEQQLKIQTLLLAKMAQKQGVADEEINNIINQ